LALNIHICQDKLSARHIYIFMATCVLFLGGEEIIRAEFQVKTVSIFSDH